MLVDSNTKIYENPATGVYDAVFADYVDLGLVPSTYKGVTTTKHKVRLVWILNAKDKEGNNFRLFQRVTVSMGKKATLFTIVKDVIGKVPDVPFDLETLIGKNVQLVAALEKADDGNEYANIKAILPAKASFVVPAGFVRDKDRKDKNQPSTPTQAQTAAPAPAASAVAYVE